MEGAAQGSPREGVRSGLRHTEADTLQSSEFSIILNPDTLQSSEFSIILNSCAGINRVFVSAVHLDWVAKVISKKRVVLKRGHQEGKHKCKIVWASSDWVF